MCGGAYPELIQVAAATFGKSGLISSAKSNSSVMSNKAVVAKIKLG